MKTCSNAIIVLLILLYGCSSSENNSNGIILQPLLQVVPTAQSNIKFRNDIDDTGEYNFYNTLYVYNGGGVSIGDIDNDGLPDIFLTSNQMGGKLYKNLGGLKFSDITETAGIKYQAPWVTGTAMVDINADGFLDIYICKSGSVETMDKENLLFINNGDGTFQEAAQEFGLNSNAASIQALFFDVENDGDLDLYLVNHPSDFKSATDMYSYFDSINFSPDIDQFFVNENGIFKDATETFGISDLNGYGLSASIADVNQDGYMDIFVANDFFRPDYLWINDNGKGFKNEVHKYFSKASMFSMGSNFADLDNDGNLDLMVVDMEPEEANRRKLNDIPLPPEFYEQQEKLMGLPQYSRNMLYRNMGNQFVEMAEYSGVAKTDWSWSAILEDFDNDGLVDVFVSNGIKKDLNNVDYNMSNLDGAGFHESKYKLNADEIIANMPSSVVANKWYRNNGKFHFEDATTIWGEQSFSTQGAATADLDLDGDLDLVLNNSDTFAFIYENLLSDDSQFIRVKATGIQNTFGIGVQLSLYSNNGIQMKILNAADGYQSSSEPIGHFGLPTGSVMDSLVALWPGGKRNVLTKVNPNSLITLNEKEALGKAYEHVHSKDYSEVLSVKTSYHEPNDFYKDKLLPYMISNQKKGLANWGNELVYSSSNSNNTYLIQNSLTEKQDTIYKWEGYREVVGIIPIVHANESALYIAFGGNNSYPYAHYSDNILLKNNGEWDICSACLESRELPTGAAAFGDVDNDGDLDLFVGYRHQPGSYGLSPKSDLYLNEDGNYIPQKNFQIKGMVTDAVIIDLCQCGNPAIVVANEWGAIQVIEFSNGEINGVKDISANGLWHSLAIVDINKDGFLDVIAGNWGQNSVFKASKEQPLSMLVGDFDKNNVTDQVLFHYLSGQKTSFYSRKQVCSQMPDFFNEFHTEQSFAETNLSLWLDSQNSENVDVEVQELNSQVFFGTESGFRATNLPWELQTGPVKVISYDAVNDAVILAGNEHHFQYEQGSIDALMPTILTGYNAESDTWNYKTLLENSQEIQAITVLDNRYILLDQKGTFYSIDY